MVEQKKNVDAYNLAILLSLFLVVALAIFIYQWSSLGTYVTIALSIELGACLFLILLLIQRKKEAQLHEDLDDKSIQRINEINNSFTQLTNELQELNERIKEGIIKSREDLVTLQTQVTEISKQEQELKNQIKIWEEVKPEAARIISGEIKKGELKNYAYGFILYVAGVVTPYLINMFFFYNT